MSTLLSEEEMAAAVEAMARANINPLSDPSGVELKKMQAALTAALPIIERALFSRPLPCDVKLPPATMIGKGCTLATLRTALKHREMMPHWPTTFEERHLSTDEQRIFHDALRAASQPVDQSELKRLFDKGEASGK